MGTYEQRKSPVMPAGRDMDVALIKGLPPYHVMEMSDDKNITEYTLATACGHANYKQV